MYHYDQRMPVRPNTKNLEDFLSVVNGSKEVGLAIARNKTELAHLGKAMKDFGLKRSENVRDLFTFSKTYFVADVQMDKAVYDFVAQYPTGQVEIFDQELMRSRSISPDYMDRTIVLLIERGDLNKLQTRGLNLLSVAGPAF